MDFIKALPKSDGHTVIMIVVDRLTKYAHFILVKHPDTALTIAHLFLDHIVKLHGMPSTIVTDRDTIFVSNFWRVIQTVQGNTSFEHGVPPSVRWPDREGEPMSRDVPSLLSAGFTKDMETMVAASRTMVQLIISQFNWLHSFQSSVWV